MKDSLYNFDEIINISSNEFIIVSIVLFVLILVVALMLKNELRNNKGKIE